MCYWCMKRIELSEKEKNDIVELYNAGNSRKNIFKKLKISEHIIRRFIEESSLDEPNYKHVGKRFGRLLVVSKLERRAKNGCPIVECLCDCGKITNVIVSNLISSSSLTVSCGCYNRDKNLSKQPWTTEYNSYIGSTVKKRNIPFNLTVEEFKTLCSSNCFYCEKKPSQKMDVGRGFKNGIDRVNNDFGYELTNCVPCCWTCNRMKGKLSNQDFIQHIKNIFNKMVPDVGLEPTLEPSEDPVLPLDEPGIA